MRIRNIYYFFLPFLFLCVNCLGEMPELKAPTEQFARKDALIFGYIEVATPGHFLEFVSLRQARPVNLKTMFISKEYLPNKGKMSGLFYLKDIPLQGSYQIRCFSTTPDVIGLRDGPTLGSCYPLYGKNQTAIRTEEAGVYFMGSYQQKVSNDSFELEPIKSPGEIELVEQLLVELKGTKWEPMLYARLITIRGTL